MPEQRPSPRFDLAPISQFQSRDGGLGSGAQMRNGFVEKDKDGELWCWQRPALVSTFSSPFVSTGQGFYISAGVLWGVFHNGTARGVQISYDTTAFTLLPGTLAPAVGYDAIPLITTYGTISPLAWGGGTTVSFYVNTAGQTLNFIQLGTTSAGRFGSINFNGNTYPSTSGFLGLSTLFGTAYTAWQWTGVSYNLTASTYTGNFTTPATSTVALTGITVNELPDWAASIAGPIMIKGTGTAFSVNGTSVTAISDPDYPANTVKGLAYLDGTFYVLDAAGKIHNSAAAADDPTTWPTDGFITAEFEPDTGVRLCKVLNYIVAFGSWTTQMFWDAANTTGSPLLPVNNGVILVGCVHANSVAQTESTVVWVAQRKAEGSTSQSGRFVAILVGTSYEEISSPDVSRVLEADDFATVKSCIVEMGGHTWYLLALGTTGITLVCDIKQKTWYVWTRLAAGTAKTIASLWQVNGLATGTSTSHGLSDGDPVVITGATPAGFNGTFNVNVTGTSVFTYPLSTTGTTTGTGASMQATPYTESALSLAASLGYGGRQVVMDTLGNVYTLSLGTALDDGSIPINWRIRTVNLDDGNNERKFASSLAVIGDVIGTGTGLVRFTDNDYTSYGYFRRFDLSQVRANQQRWGNYRRRAWEWRYTGRARYRLKAFEVDKTQGVT